MRVWLAFANHYWPALYFADAHGRIRHHHFGEGEYGQSEMVIQQLLADAGRGGANRNWSRLRPAAWKRRPTGPACDLRKITPAMSAPRTSPPPAAPVQGKPHAYAVPARLELNQWALSGDWTMEDEATTLNAVNGQIACRFHARDLNLVMGPAAPARPVRFSVSLDGRPPGEASGADVDADGNGALAQQRVYQLIRQPGSVTDRTFQITFPDAGAQAYCFTFG